jgi:hypothetical protein
MSFIVGTGVDLAPWPLTNFPTSAITKTDDKVKYAQG